METATYSAILQAEKEEHEKTYQANLKEIQERPKDSKGARRAQISQNSVDNMDVDEPTDGYRLRSRKCVSPLCYRFVCACLIRMTGRRWMPF